MMNAQTISHPSLLRFGALMLGLGVMACQSAAPDADLLTAPENVFLAKRPDVERIVDEALARGRAYDMLASLCEVAPHRLAGSDGAANAVRWARDEMLAIGLENVRLEPVIVPHWERGSVERLVFTAPAELAGEALPVLALGGSIATPASGVEAEVVEVKTFEELAALGDEASGKIVLFNRPMDDRQRTSFPAYGGAVGQRVSGAVEAAKAGSVAAIVRSMTTLRNDAPHTGLMRYADGVERVPAAAVSTNGADRIAALLAEGRVVRLRLELDCEQMEPAESFNVVGDLVGRKHPDEIIVVGGHLDCWDVGQGAHDDGGGCCQALEVVRLLNVLDLRPRRTVRVVLFMDEEYGTTGGPAYWRAHRDEMDRHVMAVESDRGVFTPRGFTTDAGEEALAILQDAVELVAETGATYMVPGGGGADIGPMAQSGVPLVGYVPDSQRYFDVHHSPLDTLEAVNRREMHLGAAAITAIVWLVADLPEALPRK